MRQLYDAYANDLEVSPLVAQVPWTHNLLILGQCKRAAERGFYLRLAIREKWGKRELEQQLRIGLFERSVGLSHLASQTCRQAANSEGRIR
jgi:predicted nuclease of restriction endonuclease-like (RecB) superfamily